jgi:hypothetical protein
VRERAVRLPLGAGLLPATAAAEVTRHPLAVEGRWVWNPEAEEATEERRESAAALPLNTPD